jgi:hypothetical protein
MKVKVFSNWPDFVEEEINRWIETENPLEIISMAQSSVLWEGHPDMDPPGKSQLLTVTVIYK